MMKRDDLLLYASSFAMLVKGLAVDLYMYRNPFAVGCAAVALYGFYREALREQNNKRPGNGYTIAGGALGVSSVSHIIAGSPGVYLDGILSLVSVGQSFAAHMPKHATLDSLLNRGKQLLASDRCAQAIDVYRMALEEAKQASPQYVPSIHAHLFLAYVRQGLEADDEEHWDIASHAYVEARSHINCLHKNTHKVTTIPPDAFKKVVDQFDQYLKQRACTPSTQ